MVDAALAGSSKTTYASEAPNDPTHRKIIEGSLTLQAH
jgi:hypothetical protein